MHKTWVQSNRQEILLGKIKLDKNNSGPYGDQELKNWLNASPNIIHQPITKEYTSFIYIIYLYIKNHYSVES